MKKYLKLMRPKHYIKNGLILLPLFFSGQLLNLYLLSKALLGIGTFCLIASVLYILNDLKDAPNDRKHLTKCNRPIAAGIVSKKSACVLASFLLFASLIMGYFASGMSFQKPAWVILTLYFLLNFCYSYGLKNIPIVDVTILASGFLLRVMYGSAITGIGISQWLYLTVIVMSFYLGLGKRHNELAKQVNGETRKVLQFYNHNFLDKICTCVWL